MPEVEGREDQDKGADITPGAEDKGTRKPATAEDGFHARRADKLEKELQTLKRQGMSEVEKLRAEAEDARKDAQTVRERANKSLLKGELRDAAGKHGVNDFDSVFALAVSQGSVSIDEDGNLVGAEKFLKSLKESKPHLFKSSGAISPGGRTPSTNGASGKELNAAVNDSIRRMTGR